MQRSTDRILTTHAGSLVRTRGIIEGMKALLLLNGGAAIALLMFIGNRAPAAAVKPIIAAAVGNSLLSFGVGTVSAASAKEMSLQAPSSRPSSLRPRRVSSLMKSSFSTMVPSPISKTRALLRSTRATQARCMPSKIAARGLR